MSGTYFRSNCADGLGDIDLGRKLYSVQIYLDRNSVIALRDEIAAKHDKRVLVAYLSQTGNTERAAQDIARVCAADLFEITLAVPYTDLFGQSNSQIRDGIKPELGGTVDNMGQYDIVFVGYPIWWHATPFKVFAPRKNDLFHVKGRKQARRQRRLASLYF